MRKLFFFAVLMFAITAINAQTQTSTKPKPANYKAAEDLMEVMNMSKTVDEAVSVMVDMQAKDNPMLEAKKDAFKTFMLKYISWSALREDYLDIYTTEFTEAELKDMAAFYKTPTGKKVAAKQNVIMMKATQLGQERMQAHMAELMEIMK